MPTCGIGGSRGLLPPDMRILQLCLSHGYGGLELYVSRLAMLLRQQGHDCRAVALHGSRLAASLAEQRVPTTFLRTHLHPLPLLAARRLGRMIDDEAIDVVHLHWSRDLPLAALAKRSCRRPVRLVHSRHMSITRPKHDVYHRYLYHSLDRLVVLSEVMRKDALRFLPANEKAIEVIYLGVPAPDPGITDRLVPPRTGADLLIGLFGRIEPLKGQHLLIEAVDLLRERGIHARARIIGHAMDEAWVAHLKQDVARRGLDAWIEFTGFLPDPMRIMPEFDVIVLATRRETFGLVLVEAMRCGVAVIGSRAGGVPEIIEHERSGLLFEPESAASLADCLQRLARDPELRRRLALAGRERAGRLFSETRHVEELERLFVRVSAPGEIL